MMNCHGLTSKWIAFIQGSAFFVSSLFISIMYIHKCVQSFKMAVLLIEFSFVMSGKTLAQSYCYWREIAFCVMAFLLCMPGLLHWNLLKKCNLTESLICFDQHPLISLLEKKHACFLQVCRTTVWNTFATII